jgi:hypothetical protein
MLSGEGEVWAGGLGLMRPEERNKSMPPSSDHPEEREKEKARKAWIKGGDEANNARIK